uniref:Uncharacterized protein n=1 Tax=Anguilla anguilla TaxID=7936 RepID=A0A0E9T4L4_ANGAN
MHTYLLTIHMLMLKRLQKNHLDIQSIASRGYGEK